MIYKNLIVDSLKKSVLLKTRNKCSAIYLKSTKELFPNLTTKEPKPNYNSLSRTSSF